MSVKVALGRARRLAGLEKGVFAYTRRRTAASWLVARGFALEKVADVALAIGGKRRFIT